MAEAATALVEAGEGLWSFVFPRSAHVRAGVGDRRVPVEKALARMPCPVSPIQAEQVHGSSIAAVASADIRQPIAGCDALVTLQTNRALVVRSADCVPILVSDPVHRVVAAAHAGWRGLAARLPSRLVALLVQLYHCRADDLEVVFGPCIRSCCYEVGSEFERFFGPFVRMRDGKRLCDLPGYAAEQLLQAGVRREHIGDSRQCTACNPQRWFSLRREGPQTGRLATWIWLDA